MKIYRSRSRQRLVFPAKVWRLRLRAVNSFLPLALMLSHHRRFRERNGLVNDAPFAKIIGATRLLTTVPFLAASVLFADDEPHWSFLPPSRPTPPPVNQADRVQTPIDRFILAKLQAKGLSLSPPADNTTLIRRVSFDLTGLPPTLEEISRFLGDRSDDAYEKMVDRYLASPRFGERWGKFWLDAAGYADSNGYFSADSDRPLAYRYRDYIIRSLSADRPLDRIVREQLAGDELCGWDGKSELTPRMKDMLIATHFLRNSQDGTGESDGNPDEVRIDRYTVLEGTVQIIGSSLLGLTMQCARCHDHKFESISQREYYQLQSMIYPAFNLKRWVKPNNRVVYAAGKEQMAAWEADDRRLGEKIAALRSEHAQWVRKNRPRGEIVFEDGFDSSAAKLTANWSNTAPGDDKPAGTPAVGIDSAKAPGAIIANASLQIIESGSAGDRAISTRQSFDWTLEGKDSWIQVTFDLLDNQVGNSPAAARIGYFIALHDFDDSDINGASKTSGGNLLLDGNPAGGAPLHLGYPGSDVKALGTIGTTGYAPGRNFGVRVTNIGQDKFRLEHLVDGAAEEKSVDVSAGDLPDGGFGFEYCCGRSFVVDNVVVERGSAATGGSQQFAEQYAAKRNKLAEQIKQIEKQRRPKPGKIAWVTDAGPEPPDVHLLVRGNYKILGEPVRPAALAVLDESSNRFDLDQAASQTPRTTGRRLAFARWLTKPGSRAAALLARVLANRIWQNHFDHGIVASADNLGIAGDWPTHEKLLNYLAWQLADGGWKGKRLHRMILRSAVYRQSSRPRGDGQKIDPDEQLLWRYPLRRLDAESIRDAMLAAAGELDLRMGGPYVPTRRTGVGEVVVDENRDGARRRSVYLQSRRTQIASILDTFDAPSIVFSCTRRATTTVPLQSLSLLNSDFARRRAKALTARIASEVGSQTENRIDRAFLLTFGRTPSNTERTAALEFIENQPGEYKDQTDAQQRAWVDFCQTLMASNGFLYVE